jgi:hypothetical protein
MLTQLKDVSREEKSSTTPVADRIPPRERE